MKATPLFIALLLSSSLQAEPVYLAAPEKNDPVVLRGDYEPAREPELPVLILLHGMGSTRWEWTPLINAARRRGWGTLAYDARGHGDSQLTVGKKTVRHQDPQNRKDPAFWLEMPKDLLAVADLLKIQKEVALDQMVFVGASLGANVGLAAADQRPDIPAVVALSPGIDYAGIKTEPVLRRWKRPLLLVAAKPDAYAFQSVLRLRELSPDLRFLDLVLLDKPGPQGAHGTQLFDGRLEEKILDWIAQALKLPPSPAK